MRLIPLLAVASALLAPQQMGMVAMSAKDAQPLKVGATAPDAKLKTSEGEETTLNEIRGEKPTILVFYRGDWCPYCNKHLADLQTVEPELTKLGYQLVAITPDQPSEIKKTIGKHNLSYKIYSDTKADSLKAFGVAFKLDDATNMMMKDKYHVDIEMSAGGETHHILPVPSVFLISKEGKITYAYSNPDYKVRLKGSEVLAAAKHDAMMMH